MKNQGFGKGRALDLAIAPQNRCRKHDCNSCPFHSSTV